MWVCGIRQGKLYTIEERPTAVRSNSRLQELLGWCATGQHLGLTPDRAFLAAEALVMKSIYHGIEWPSSTLTEDIAFLLRERNLDISRK